MKSIVARTIDKLFARARHSRPHSIDALVVSSDHRPLPATAPVEVAEVAETDGAEKPKKIELLTGPDGSCPLPPEIAKDCAVMSDGTFYVRDAKIIDSAILDIARMVELVCADKIAGKKVARATPVTRDFLGELYGQQALSRLPNRTEMSAMARSILERGTANRATEIHIYYFRDELTVRFVVNNSQTPPVSDFKLNGAACHQLYTVFFAMGDSGDSYENPDEDQERTITNREKLAGFGLTGARMMFLKTATGRHLDVRPMYEKAIDGDGIEALEISQRAATSLYEVMNENEGVVIVTGPTGAGKTTLADKFFSDYSVTNDNDKVIVLIADPPESENPLFITIDVRGNKDGLGFRRARKTMLRINPDAIFVGESRDLESAMSSYEIGLTNKLCLTTNHTSRALNAPFRQMSFGVPAEIALDPMLNLAWTGQRLIPQLCEKCAIPAKEARSNKRLAANYDRLKTIFGDQIDGFMAKGPGCSHCKSTRYGKLSLPGYEGPRKLVFEIVRPDDPLCDLLAKKDHWGARRYWLDACGGESMPLLAYPLLREGKISFNDYYRAFSNQHVTLFDMAYAGIIPLSRLPAHLAEHLADRPALVEAAE